MNGIMMPVTVADRKIAERCLKGRVVLIDDDSEIVSALVGLIEMEGYFCESYLSAQDFLDASCALNYPGPWCVLSDVKMPDIDGLELQRLLLNKGNPPLILMSGGSGAYEAVAGLRTGAIDFLIKPFDADVLMSAIEVAILKSSRSQESSSVYLDAKKRLTSLTTREVAVVNLLMKGKINREIAEELDIALRTVKLHRQHAFEKLGVSKIIELVKLMEVAIQE
ncbi:MAG: response regulator [Methylococcales bacterium]|nr:response regulator [Methylococcales bacterium]